VRDHPTQLQDLPTEILLHILKFLSDKDKGSLAQASLFYRNLNLYNLFDSSYK
jgi:hypothetical protein